jgi:signal transduction histidine kinase/DNA-binding response OmpR family regulator/predicted RNA-binding protein with RPS1 domain
LLSYKEYVVSDDTSHVYRLYQSVTAQVEQVFPFGVFVRLPDGTPAYVRRRELTQAGNLDPRQSVADGQEIEAVVVALAEPGRKLELSVRRAEPDPWDTFAHAFKVRDTVTATVKRLSSKGALVQVVPGVDGFIPLAELATWPVKVPQELLWVGDQVEGMITRLEREGKRLRLSVRQQMEHQARVREVMQLLDEKGTVREEWPEDEETYFVEAQDGAVAPGAVARVGRVLVVDDHAEVREPLVTWLHRLGFAAQGAESSAQALACLKERDYGLALVDLDLCGEDGLSLIQTLSRIAPGTPVAVMSTPEWVAQRIEELTTLAVIDAFAKPLDLGEVRETLVQLGQGQRPTPFWSLAAEPKPAGAFQRLAGVMRRGTSLVARFEAGLEALVRLTDAEQGVIFRLDPASQQVSIVARFGALTLNKKAVAVLGESPVKDVIREKNDVFETHVSCHSQSRFGNLLALLSFESCLGVSIKARCQVQHAVFLFHRRPEAFSHYRLRDTRAMAVLFGVALESQAVEERIRAVTPFLLSGQLAAGFGHEVYNKMSGLEIQLRNLQADCERLKQEAQPCDVLELSKATDQLLEVALDLKDAVTLFRELVRAEQEEEVDVNEVVAKSAQLLRPTARQQRVRLELNLASDLPPLVGSAVRLQQVFVNLILNAVQQTALKMKQWPGGRGTLKVTTEQGPEQALPIRVCFADNGPGIHRQLWEDVFALGFSTRTGGTGLGLFIAKSLVESMGGAIYVERSVIPAGTTFRVDLPTLMVQSPAARGE